MRSILLHIADDDCLEAKLQVALDLARSYDGHVTCLQAVPFEIGLPDSYHGAMAAQILPELRKAADRLRQRIEQRLAGEDVAWNWLQEDGHSAGRLIARSGLSDLIVVGGSDPISRGPFDLPGEVAIRSRTPILLIPPKVRAFDHAGAALVAWDGSPEACRALRAATPLLARAESVILATIAEGPAERKFELPAIEGAAYLSRHDIACELIEFPAADRSIAEVLIAAAAMRDAAYLVMGTYGRARLSEMIWGGVTRELFADPPLPIFACH